MRERKELQRIDRQALKVVTELDKLYALVPDANQHHGAYLHNDILTAHVPRLKDIVHRRQR